MSKESFAIMQMARTELIAPSIMIEALLYVFAEDRELLRREVAHAESLARAPFGNTDRFDAGQLWQQETRSRRQIENVTEN